MSGIEFGQGFGMGDAEPNAGVGANTQPSGVPNGPGVAGQGTQRSPARVGPESVVGEDVLPGGSNVSGGVTRRKRRAIRGLAQTRLGGPVPKNYATTAAVMFNNIEEMVQDTISREHAQDIVEELFDKWGIPTGQPETVKYAEDMLWTFLIAATASNKADYDRLYEVPVKNGAGGVVAASFSVLSRLLESVHGVTRRQFSRAVADDQRNFIRLDENQFMIPLLATRIGCDPQMAHLAFDGSTHCTGMTSREVAFTKTLESRNLFERDDVLAQGASDKLMQGQQRDVRSVVPR